MRRSGKILFLTCLGHFLTLATKQRTIEPATPDSCGFCVAQLAPMAGVVVEAAERDRDEATLLAAAARCATLQVNCGPN